MDRDKIIMFDVDGVVVAPGSRTLRSASIWTADLARDLGIDPGKLASRFFAPGADGSISLMERCSTGRAEIGEVLPSVLEAIGYVGDLEDFLAYWFEHDAYVDPTLLDAVDFLRARGYRCCLATSQERRRGRFLWEELRLREHFSAMYCSVELGISKKDPSFFHAISAAEQCLTPLYFDDRAEVVTRAAAAGWRATLYDDVESVRRHPMLAKDFLEA